MPITHIVYLSHGGRKYYDQTRFSVLTLLHLLSKNQCNDIRIVVYTDQLGSVPQHEWVQGILLGKEQIQNYRGRFDYIHRIKIKILQRATQELETDLLYVDCDTRWLQLPRDIINSIRNGGVCMHTREGDVGQDFFPEYASACIRYKTQFHDLGVIDISKLSMWNAGAIGVPSGAKDFFDTTLAVSDFLYTRVKPKNWIEQFAFSLAAQNRYEVHALGDVLHHYWNYSFEAPMYLSEVFSAMGDDLTLLQQADYCANLEWSEERLKELQRDPKNKRLRWIKKMRNSLYKRKVNLLTLLARLDF